MKNYLATEQQGIELLYRDNDIYDVAFENVNQFNKHCVELDLLPINDDVLISKDFNIPKHYKELDIEKYVHSVDLLLIGTGANTIIPNEKLIRIMFDKKKGLEFMNTQSACKTHNLLLSENRSFSSILYP